MARRLRGVLASLSCACAIGCAAAAGSFHDADLLAFTETVEFDPTSLERWSLYVTRISIGATGQWPDFDSSEVKRRILARLDRDRADLRTRVIVMLWQHYPEAHELLATRRLSAASRSDDAILLTTLMQRHMSAPSVDPDAQAAWERDLAALAKQPVRLDAAYRGFMPYVGKARPGPDELHGVRELASGQEIRAPGPGITLRSTAAFWDALIAAAARSPSR